MQMNRRDALARLAALGALVFLRPRRLYASAKPFTHPDPRPGITGEHVLTRDQIGKRKKIVYDAYDYAREHPEIFDGIYCSCDCSKGKAGHRSLLACYESAQPTGCMACQEEGEFVGKLAAEGKSLSEIRAAVDKEYG
jgi:hypothetical protein